MSLRLEMLQVARLAPKLLHESRDLVEEFLRNQINSDGGFKDRTGKSDLYYTVFGIEGLMALRADVPAQVIGGYLNTIREDETLDFVHLCCLARCCASLAHRSVQWAGRTDRTDGTNRSSAHRSIVLDPSDIARRLETYRSNDGGFASSASSENGTIYACFLALGAYQDLGIQLHNVQAFLACVHRLRSEDGGYSNYPAAPVGQAPATAGAVNVLRQLNQPIDPVIGSWLLSRHHEGGGFFATPQAPIPDLLSTATALHALAAMQLDLDKIREPCLDFVDSLWTNEGGFHGNWTDDQLDTEYTYYGLLALGHLSL